MPAMQTTKFPKRVPASALRLILVPRPGDWSRDLLFLHDQGNCSLEPTISEELSEARSRLYRSRLLRSSTRSKCLDEIYQIDILLHLSVLKISPTLDQRSTTFSILFIRTSQFHFELLLLQISSISIEIYQNFSKSRRSVEVFRKSGRGGGCNLSEILLIFGGSGVMHQNSEVALVITH